MKADSFAVLHLAGGESRALTLQVGVSLLQRRLPLRLLRNHMLLPTPHHRAQPTIRTELLLTRGPCARTSIKPSSGKWARTSFASRRGSASLSRAAAASNPPRDEVASSIS